MITGAACIQKLDQGYTFRSAQTSLKEFLENWLVSIQSSRAPRTLDCSVVHIQRLFDRRMAEGASSYTIKRIRKVLHVALGRGVKLGLLTRNPVSATIPPRIQTREMCFYTEKEVRIFLEVAETIQPELYPLYYLAIHTGMRKSELLGLQWEDVDWKRSTLQVQRQLRWVKGRQYEFPKPKTSKGIRSIVLGEKAMDVLRAHLGRQPEGKHDLMFVNGNGEPLRDHVLYRNFKQVMGEAGLPEIRFHDLRHTAASLMLNYGLPHLTVSRRLGHARPSITMDVYGHIIPSRQEEAASIMDNLMMA